MLTLRDIMSAGAAGVLQTSGVLVFVKAVAVGAFVAMPLGPIGVLCARRTLSHGRPSGFASGLGAATADAIFALMAGSFVSYAGRFFQERALILRVLSGVLLLCLGAFIYRSKPASARSSTARCLASSYLSTFFLTLGNPMTFVAFAGLFATFGLALHPGAAALTILGVFLGSFSSLGALCVIISNLDRNLSCLSSSALNRISGSLIGLCGLFTLLSLLS